MISEKHLETIRLIADSIETGYSSVFTFAVRERLSRADRNEVVNLLRFVADDKNYIAQMNSGAISSDPLASEVADERLADGNPRLSH